MFYRTILSGCGAYLPERIVTNKELSKTLETSDEWIQQRTGICERRIADNNELTSNLAVNAARNALENSGVSVSEIDLIVLATATPDKTFPATATKVQADLGIFHGAAFDIQAVCTGFIYALNVADNFIKLGQARNALVIGAETFSRILDWKDRRTCVLFGDGAGAVVLSAAEKGDKRGILSTHIRSDGRHQDLLHVDGGPSSTMTVGYLRMEGREVFKHAVTNMSAILLEALAENKLEANDIDWLVPHQANKRILDSTAKKIGLPAEKVVLTVDRHANTSAASIPLALSEAAGDGRIKQNDLVVLEAMGGGFTWGAAVIRW
ncbi:MAG: 3-oxoacyl-ACP synthase [Rhodospirillaceae bacterium]|nr:3-oxoacyl-ACP synthase [Rhodospirillaceae bacterium]|tara:strand:+ start:1631 stop:2596 length:966 start_codon:yes stop_codon:yes gene_type:complete